MTRRYFLGLLGLAGCYPKEVISPVIKNDSTAMKKQIIGWWNGVGYDSDAQSFFTAAGITDATQKNAVNTMVVALKAASLWTLCRAVYPYVGGTATTHKYNLKDPRDLDAAYRIAWSGGVTHDSNGVTFNGSTGFGETFLNPLTVFGVSYMGMHSYIKQGTWTNGIIIGGNTRHYDWNNGGNNVINNGSAAQVDVPDTQSYGLRSVVVKDASGPTLVVNGNPKDYTNAFVANGNNNMYVGKYSGGLFSNGTVMFQAITDNMTKAQCDTLNTIVYNYELALSRSNRPNFYVFGTSIEKGLNSSPQATKKYTYLLTENKLWNEVNNAVASSTLQGAAVGGTAGNIFDNYTTIFPTKRANDKYIYIHHAINDARLLTDGGGATQANFISSYETVIDYLINTLGWSANEIIISAGQYNDTNPTSGQLTGRFYDFVTSSQTVASNKGCQFYNPQQYMIDNGGQSLVDADNVHYTNTGHDVMADYYISVLS